MVKEFLKKYCGVMLFYLAVIGVSYIICSNNNVVSMKNDNSLNVSVNK